MQTIPSEEAVARKFRLERAPTLLALQKAVAPIAFTRLHGEGAFPGRTMAAPPEEAFSFQVALAPMPAGEIWIDGKYGKLPAASAGDTFIFNLAEKSDRPFESALRLPAVLSSGGHAGSAGLRSGPASGRRAADHVTGDPRSRHAGTGAGVGGHGSGASCRVRSVGQFDRAGIPCACCACLRRLLRKRKPCRDGARTLAASARPRLYRSASRRRSGDLRSGAGMWPVCEPFWSRLSAGYRYAATQMVDEETDRTSEGFAAQRRQSTGTNCPRLRFCRPKPSHANLRAIRGLRSGKMASAPLRLIRPVAFGRASLGRWRGTRTKRRKFLWASLFPPQ